MKDTIEILTEARQLIAAPWAWCQGYVTKTLFDTVTEEVRIIARCAIGAVTGITIVPCEAKAALRALVDTGNLMPPIAFIANANALIDNAVDNDIEAYLVAHWNDNPHRTHAEVIDLFDRSIERLKADRRAAIVEDLLVQAHVILAGIEKADAPLPVLVSDAA